MCGGENASPTGWAPDSRSPTLWVCDECWPYAQAGYAAQKNKTEFEKRATKYAGERGGEYLEKIGKTDLALLSPEEWATFLDAIFYAKKTELRRLYAPGAPLRW